MLEEQQITEATGHKLLAVRKYKHTSMEKQCEMSDVLYGKCKKTTSTVSKPPDTNFDLGVNSQMELMKPQNPEPKINISVPKVEINTPVINIQAPKVTVNPVINLRSQDLVTNSDECIELPEISINLTININ